MLFRSTSSSTTLSLTDSFPRTHVSLLSTVLSPGLCICFSSCLDHSSLRCPHDSKLLFIWVSIFLNSENFPYYPLKISLPSISPAFFTFLSSLPLHLTCCVESRRQLGLGETYAWPNRLARAPIECVSHLRRTQPPCQVGGFRGKIGRAHV